MTEKAAAEKTTEKAADKPKVPEVKTIQMVDVDKLEVAPWNPTESTEKSLANLMTNIKEVGFLQNLNVVPLSDGKYRIIDGHDKAEAARRLGMRQVPCVINSEWSEEFQKLQAIRLNVIKKGLSSQKFMALYLEMAAKWGEKATDLKLLMTDKSALDQMKKNYRSGMTAGMKKEFDQKSGDVKTVEDLTSIVAEMYSRCGSSLDKGFLVFSFGNSDHYYIALDKSLKRKIDQLILRAEVEKIHITELFKEALGVTDL